MNEGSNVVESFNIDDIAGLQTAITDGGATPVSQFAYSPNQKKRTAGLVEFLIHNNIARVLADPTLVVTTGHPASFHSGGEVPAVSSTDPASEVTYRKTGTEMSVLAHSQENGRVRIDIRGSVRELDEAHSITVNGAKVPALKVRQFDTAVEGTIGQPIVLSGLVEKRVEAIRSEAGLKEVVNHIALIAIIVPELVGAQAQAKPRIGDTKQQRIKTGDVVTVVFEQECAASQLNLADWPDSDGAKCSFRIAAQVVQVRPNGDLVVEGRRDVFVNESVIQQKVSGVVRPDSIDPESRTVPSNQIAELRVERRTASTPTPDSKRR